MIYVGELITIILGVGAFILFIISLIGIIKLIKFVPKCPGWNHTGHDYEWYNTKTIKEIIIIRDDFISFISHPYQHNGGIGIETEYTERYKDFLNDLIIKKRDDSLDDLLKGL